MRCACALPASRQWQASHGQPGQAKDLLWQRQAADQDALLALCEAAQRSLSLEGPLLRAVLVGKGDGSQRLLLVIHHLVIDGVSWRVLFEDLQQACAQLDAQQPVRLPAKTSAYKRSAERLAEHARSDAMARASWPGGKASWPMLRRTCRAPIRPAASRTAKPAACIRGWTASSPGSCCSRPWRLTAPRSTTCC